MRKVIIRNRLKSINVGFETFENREKAKNCMEVCLPSYFGLSFPFIVLGAKEFIGAVCQSPQTVKLIQEISVGFLRKFWVGADDICHKYHCVDHSGSLWPLYNTNFMYFPFLVPVDNNLKHVGF